MLRDILSRLDSQSRRELYRNKLVCGCMYRSFTDIEANLFFRITGNEGRITQREIKDFIYNKAMQRVKEVYRHFAELDIIISSPREVMNETFELHVNRDFAKNL